ncbi:helix-turn-helix domain-containing protein [Desulfobacterales bacterium HSG17]|nr:helix-turn-helix domain-containing protein [Desulfobacterales bacterium HSG17]
MITDALNKHNWRKGKAAKTLGINPRTLYRKIKQLGLAEP